jgi:hypothetical protein
MLLGCILIASSGCQTTTVQCQREMALLRAEILDLEDKYYALQAQHRTALADGSGAVVSQGVIGNGIIEGSRIVGSPTVIEGYPEISGDVIYTDEVIVGSSMMPTGEVYYEGQPVRNGQPIMTPGVIQNAPTLAPTPNSNDLPIESAPTLEPSTTTEDQTDPSSVTGDQALLLPDDTEFEVGYENLELSIAEVDRIEIVSQATRGKNLDESPGDDGIEVMIQTLDVNQKFIDASGELTVTVRDQQLGEIGKWTFLPKELQLFLSRDEFDNTGILLHLPWTGQVPVSDVVDVRAKMLINGIEYIATMKLKINPPTSMATKEAVVGWTASDRRWLTGSTPVAKRRKISSQPSANSRSTAIERPQWKPVR